jgi:hypothetical protein
MKKFENQQGYLSIPFGPVFNFKVIGLRFGASHFRFRCLGLRLTIKN